MIIKIFASINLNLNSNLLFFKKYLQYMNVHIVHTVHVYYRVATLYTCTCIIIF